MIAQSFLVDTLLFGSQEVPVTATTSFPPLKIYSPFFLYE